MSEDHDGTWECPEDNTVFVDCTCEHLPDQHGWGSCDVDDCPCEGGWEE